MYVNVQYLNARLHITNLRGIVTADDIRRWMMNGEIRCFVSSIVFEEDMRPECDIGDCHYFGISYCVMFEYGTDFLFSIAVFDIANIQYKRLFFGFWQNTGRILQGTTNQ
jgi:hypothetical protein